MRWIFPGNAGLRESCCASLPRPLLNADEKAPAAPLKAIELEVVADTLFVCANAIGCAAVSSPGVGAAPASSVVGAAPSGAVGVAPSGAVGAALSGVVALPSGPVTLRPPGPMPGPI